MALADQRSKARLNERALPFGNAFDVDALDKSVNDDKAKRPAVLELLRRHRDANQHVAARGVGLFDRVGGGEDLGDGCPAASEFRGDGRGVGREFRKAAFHRHIRDGDRELRGVWRRSESRRTAQGDRARWTGRRRQRARRHARRRHRLSVCEVCGHREGDSRHGCSRSPLRKHTPCAAFSKAQAAAPPLLPVITNSSAGQERQLLCGEPRRNSGGGVSKYRSCNMEGTPLGARDRAVGGNRSRAGFDRNAATPYFSSP